MSSKTSSIYALFSVDNDYNQPGHNLVGWWSQKPSLETIANATGVMFPSTRDDETVAVVKIWSMQAETIELNGTDYRLRLISEGTKLDADQVVEEMRKRK
jgi:hypothetical protein